MKRALLAALFFFSITGSFADNIDTPSITYGNSATTPGIAVYRARGQFGSAEHLYTNDVINGIYGTGYGSAFQSSPGVSIKLKASENWSSTSQGSKITFETTPAGKTSAQEVLSIGQNGALNFVPSTFTFSVSNLARTIVPTATFQYIGSSGTSLMVALPNISTTSATAGQRLVLLSTAATITLQNDSTLHGSCMFLSAASLAVTTNTAKEFIFRPGVGTKKAGWFEVQ